MTDATVPNRIPDPARDLVLGGLDGTNPLGFLAALGLFRVASDSRRFDDLRMRWVKSAATWVPALQASSGVLLDEDSLLTMLTARLANDISNHPARLLAELGKASIEPLGSRVVLEGVIEGGDRTWMDWAASLASDCAPADSINQLQTARRDYFFGNITTVISRTTKAHLLRSLFHPWDYADALDNQSLHLDPSEDRRHAYQWNKPAGDPDRKSRGGMLGANRLALEAIPLFPSFPEADTLRTVGFTGTRSTDTRWTWPLWNVGILLPTVRSLLGAAILQAEHLELTELHLLRSLGVAAAYRTDRILVGKTPNFTPARRIA